MVTELHIRERAYTLWRQEGNPSDLWEYYLRTKQMLEEREADLLLANKQVRPTSTLQLDSVPKPVNRQTGKSIYVKA